MVGVTVWHLSMSSYASLSIFNAILCYILAALTSWAYTDLLVFSNMFCYRSYTLVYYIPVVVVIVLNCGA